MLVLDHLLGLRIREHESFPSLNYDPANPDTYDIILSSYSITFCFCHAAYFVLSVCKTALFCRDVLKPHEKKGVVYSRQFIPSSRSLVLLNVGLLALYIYFDIEMLSRAPDLASSFEVRVRTSSGYIMNRYTDYSPFRRIYSLLNTAHHYPREGKEIFSVSLSAVILMSLYTGDRSTLFIVIIIMILVHKPVVRRVDSLVFMVMAVLFLCISSPPIILLLPHLQIRSQPSFSGKLFSNRRWDFPGLRRRESFRGYPELSLMTSRMEKQHGATYLITTITNTAQLNQCFASLVPSRMCQHMAVAFTVSIRPFIQ